RGFNERLLERVRALPGVARADLATNSPLDTNWQTSWHVPGTPDWPKGQSPLAEMNVVSDGYFKTLAIPLRRGRTFDATDTPNGERAIIIDQAFAERAFAGKDPLGQKLNLGGAGEKPVTIVGVVPTVKVYGYASEPTLVQAYLSARQDAPNSYMLLVRA